MAYPKVPKATRIGWRIQDAVNKLKIDKCAEHVSNDTTTYQYTEQGLTKRELIAAMALQGLLAGGYNRHTAKDAIQATDELLELLSKEDEK